MKKANPTKKRAPDVKKANRGCIVGIGASAGGLEALIALFKSFPKKTDLAFVLIQHLEPRHKSALVEILSRETVLEVREAKNNMAIRPACVHVIPPNSLMTVVRGRLRIKARVRRADGSYLPVDHFMASLAADRGKRAIGVILSGTGSDGTAGAQAVKARGGIVFAQDKKTARYYGMPGSAAASGAVDFVLAPLEIAKKLIYMSAHGFRVPARRPTRSLAEETGLPMILAVLLERTGVNFIQYKKATVSRRIGKRMAYLGLKTYSDYYAFLKWNPAEAEALLKDILIPVTAFFRDRDVFTALRKKVFPSLAGRRTAKTPVRVWVPACSTGEEVYSIAIALYEFMEERKAKPHILIFGTDVNDELIERARSGVFPKAVAAQVSAERRRRFFVKTQTGYKIDKPIRDLCVFAKHDVTVDPPLSNMDLASCRNLLIYLDNPMQERALSLLHYALKPAGFLVLGTSETPGAAPGLFTPLDKKSKIYARNNAARAYRRFGVQEPGASLKTSVAGERRAIGKAPGSLRAPRPPVASRLRRAGAESRRKTASGPRDPASGSTIKDVAGLKKEFQRTVERLNAVSEEKDIFNEELQSANEEIQSSNEELRSLNEELETSKEELQATNEELQTLNEELQNKNVELLNLNGDLNNVFASTNTPMIIVGNDLRIKRFTPTARKVMNLIPTDVDRPIGDIKLKIDIPGLEKMIRGATKGVIPPETEVRDKDGRWYSLRIRPYLTMENTTEGAVIALFDIDAIKKNRDEARRSLEYTRAIFETIREPLLVLDEDVRVISANRSFFAMFKLRAADVEKKSLFTIGGGEWDNRRLRKLIEDILPRKTHFDHFELAVDFPGTGPKTLMLNARQVKLHGRDKRMILLAMEDFTKRKKAAELLRRDSRMLEKMVQDRSRELLDLRIRLERSKHLSDIGTLAATVAHELRNVLSAVSVSVFGIRRKVKEPLIEGSLAGIEKKLFEGEQIINNVLSYSKIQISRFQPVRINDVLESVIGEARDRAVEFGISVQAGLAPTEGLMVEADPVQLKEVFSNILTNAFDAVSGNGGLVAIESTSSDVVFSVTIRDNGEGVPPADLPRVLDPFFTTKAKGTGLGLAVCSQILMLHDGSITLESEKGEGTTVRVTLPRHRIAHA